MNFKKKKIAGLPLTQPLPRHVAIIMDGNGRWAIKRGLPRIVGHRQGVESVRKTIEAAVRIGIPCLTVFSFSSENWTRPEEEINELMGLLRRFIQRDLAELHSQNIKIKIIGTGDRIDPDIANLILEAEELTQFNDGLQLVVAFNYGARDEITRAVIKIATKVQGGQLLPEDITQDVISDNLDTAGIPDPDLLIRTSGEARLSNFLLWQCAYTEFVFTDVYWPDFGYEAFEEAIREYQKRDRRFGGLGKDAAG